MMLTQLIVLACAHVCRAVTGDVSFRAANKLVHLNPASLSTSIDVFVEVDGMANVPATGWGMIVNIMPQAGAVGTVQFNPPAIVNSEPNLMPASQNPFIDFDRDYGGKSYGSLRSTAAQLNAFSYYFSPTLGPAPPLDANGNLSLPDGRGLVSLPLLMSANATGDFLITFDPDPDATGVILATGMSPPNDVDIHPAGTHTGGVLSVINPAGDFNRNGVVDAADYVTWRKYDGTQDGYNAWRANFGTIGGSGAGAPVNATVPEPATLVLLIMAAAGWCLRRARAA
jgi:hypothetical protein